MISKVDWQTLFERVGGVMIGALLTWGGVSISDTRVALREHELRVTALETSQIEVGAMRRDIGDMKTSLAVIEERIRRNSRED